VFSFLYDVNESIEKKIEIIAREIYGADGIEIEPHAAEQIARYARQGFDKLPICMAKTHLSLSHDPARKGAPKGQHTRLCMPRVVELQASNCRSKKCAHRWAPASCFPCAATCKRCPACPHDRASSTSKSIQSRCKLMAFSNRAHIGFHFTQDIPNYF